MFKSFLKLSIATLGISMSACNLVPRQTHSNNQNVQNTNPLLDTTSFDNMINNKTIKLYQLHNAGFHAAITNYGARIVSLQTPDRVNKTIDVVLGYKNLSAYMKPDDGFYGSIVGRYANRIAKGKFSIEGQTYQLEINDGPNTLHGGKSGFYAKVWDVKMVTDSTLELHYTSPDGEGGYPGKLEISAIYTLHKDGLEISYRAATNKSTVINLTNHAYFNLSGEGDSTILDHELSILANNFTPIDSTLIPTGKIESVVNTPLDFTKATAIGARINSDDPQLKLAGGYDHNFVLNKNEGFQLAAIVKSPKTGITMEVWTDQPGIQFYSGNFMKNIKDAKGGKTYGYRSGFCLETQHFPDSPNQPLFPSTLLKPNQYFQSRTFYKFKTPN